MTDTITDVDKQFKNDQVDSAQTVCDLNLLGSCLGFTVPASHLKRVRVVTATAPRRRKWKSDELMPFLGRAERPPNFRNQTILVRLRRSRAFCPASDGE